MQGHRLLHKLIEKSSSSIHKKRITAVTNAVDALLVGKELSLTGIARSSSGKAKERHAIRRTDRLLGNMKLHNDLSKLYCVPMSYLIMSCKVAYILIDWSCVNDKKKWFILRASLALKGRSHTLYQEVHPKQNSPIIEREFLKKLKSFLPDIKIVIITDAGFRCSWFKAAQFFGFEWVGRVRNRNKYRSSYTNQWKNTQGLYKEATLKPQLYNEVTLARSNPIKCHLVLIKKKIKGRKCLNKTGTLAKSNGSKRAARSAREPWLIATSLSISNKNDMNKIIKLYEKRMQIEEEFRDTKSHRYGFGLRDSLTSLSQRLEVLLLIATLATFVCWLIGLSAYEKKRQLDYQSNSIKTGGVLSVIYLACRLVRKGERFTQKELLASLKQLQSMTQIVITL